MIFTFQEIIDITIMIAAAGFIFMNMLSQQVLGGMRRAFSWHDFYFACLVAGPAIVLHEIGHKFSALSFGISATLHAPYLWLAAATVLVLIKFPIIFFVGGYVEHAGGTWLQNSIISFSGPLINLVLWLGALAILKNKKFSRKINKKYIPLVYLTKQINMFLFIFNMLPIPGFDGYAFFLSIYHVFFG